MLALGLILIIKRLVSYCRVERFKIMAMSKPPVDSAMGLVLMDVKVPGTQIKAPLFIWGVFALSLIAVIGTSVWIHSYNRSE